MKVLFYSVKEFEAAALKAHAFFGMEAEYIKHSLSRETALLAKGYDAISVFTADDCSAQVIEELRGYGIKYIALRCTGYDNVDVEAAGKAGIRIANVPGYSPHAIAEHTVALMLALNRKLVMANEQVHQHNFTVDNLVGFNLNQKKAGIIGTGRIGKIMARILSGFGCTLYAYDLEPDTKLTDKYNVVYTDLPDLCKTCDIISLHVPLNDRTRHMIDKKLIREMKPGVMLINTARGAVVDTQELINGLESGKVGYYGMDVYEHEKGLFFLDRSGNRSQDPLLKKLMEFPNVLITPHQAFATHEAIASIAGTTFNTLISWAIHNTSENEIAPGSYATSINPVH